MSIAHPCPGEWNWWASFGEDRFQIGPEDTRADVIINAVTDGLGDYLHGDGEWRTSFVIAHCQDRHNDLAEWFNVSTWLEDVHERMDDNGCGSDEDGNQHPLEELSQRDVDDLQASIRLAIRHWQDRKGLTLRSPYFASVVSEEGIDFPLPEGGREELALELAIAKNEEGDA